MNAARVDDLVRWMDVCERCRTPGADTRHNRQAARRATHEREKENSRRQGQIHDRSEYQDQETLPRRLRRETGWIVILAVLARHLDKAAQWQCVQRIQCPAPLPRTQAWRKAQPELFDSHAHELCHRKVPELVDEYQDGQDPKER